MSAQTSYRHTAAIGSPGGIVDLSPYSVDTFISEEETGTLKFGVGVFKGKTAGNGVKLPTSDSVSTDFEGITVNNRTTETDMEGKLSIRKHSAVGVMRYGKVYALVATGAEPKYGEPVYIIKSGDEAGYVTNKSDGTIPIKARFAGAADSSANVVSVELFNQAQENVKEPESNSVTKEENNDEG